jgi:hypothetical protein
VDVAAKPAARAVPTFLKFTHRTPTDPAIASSERSVHASSTTNTFTGTSTRSAAAATLARHRGSRSLSSCAGITTVISRNAGPTNAAMRA